MIERVDAWWAECSYCGTGFEDGPRRVFAISRADLKRDLERAGWTVAGTTMATCPDCMRMSLERKGLKVRTLPDGRVVYERREDSE